MFEDADRDPTLIDRGALNFVIVGAGATGTELAGSMADMIHDTMPDQYRDLAVSRATVQVVDLGHVVLNGFSDRAHKYASKVLTDRGVTLRLGTGVKEVAADHVVLSDGTTIKTRCVAWAGGLMAAAPAAASGLPQGRGGRIDVGPDLTPQGAPGVYVIGDMANIPGPDGQAFPQLGSVAQQSGQCVAESILAEIAGEPRKTFDYKDKGIMAMIGRGAAVAEVGKHRHELHGSIAFAAWLGVHAALMSGVRNRIEAFVDWGWDYFSKTRGPQVLDQRPPPPTSTGATAMTCRGARYDAVGSVSTYARAPTKTMEPKASTAMRSRSHSTRIDTAARNSTAAKNTVARMWSSSLVLASLPSANTRSAWALATAAAANGAGLY